MPFTESELCATSHGPNPITATFYLGRVIGPDEIRGNLRTLCRVLDPLAERFGWRVSSGYRSPDVNLAVGGAAGSAHMIGLACDGTPARGTIAEVINWLASARADLPLDRVIFEVRPGGRRWLHVQASGKGSGSKPRFFFSPSSARFLPVTADQLAAYSAAIT